MEYSHKREGDLLKVEIRDSSRRVLYRDKFNIRNKKAILSLLTVLEKFSGFSIINLVKEKMDVGEWW